MTTVFDGSTSVGTAAQNFALALAFSSHTKAPLRPAAADFFNFDALTLQLNPGGASTEHLLTSDAESVTVDGNWTVVVDGSMRTETDKDFNNQVGAAFKGKGTGTASGFAVKLDANLIFKGPVTQTFHIPQTNTEDNELKMTAGGLTLVQLSEHRRTVNGTKTDIVIGNITENIKTGSTSDLLYHGVAYNEQYRGQAISFVPISLFDTFIGLRSEFDEVLQINVSPGYTLICHLMLKVVQGVGGAAGYMNMQVAGVKTFMHGVEHALNGFRGWVGAVSGRFAPLTLGVIRIFL